MMSMPQEQFLQTQASKSYVSSEHGTSMSEERPSPRLASVLPRRRSGLGGSRRIVAKIVGDVAKTLPSDLIANRCSRRLHQLEPDWMALIESLPSEMQDRHRELQQQVISELRGAALLDVAEVNRTLGADSDSETMRLQQASSLLGLPFDDGCAYPRFQFDTENQRLHDVVCAVNKILRANREPWAAASWWFSPHGAIGMPPADLVNTDRASALVDLAKAVTEPAG